MKFTEERVDGLITETIYEYCDHCTFPKVPRKTLIKSSNQGQEINTKIEITKLEKVPKGFLI